MATEPAEEDLWWCGASLRHRLPNPHHAMGKKTTSVEEWERKLAAVKVRKEDMNKLVMNFLVTEGYLEAAQIFQTESGTQRTSLPSLRRPPGACTRVLMHDG